MTEDEKDNFDREKFEFDQRKLKSEEDRFAIKEANDNKRAALNQAHEDHRQALGMIFKTAVANTTVFAGLTAFYIALPSTSIVKFGVLLMGLVSWSLGVVAQKLSLRAYKINSENYLSPVRTDLELRRS